MHKDKETTFTYNLTLSQIELLRKKLEEYHFDIERAPYTHFKANGDKVTVSAYDSGAVVIQGKGAKDFVTFILEPDVLQKATLGYEEILEPELFEPHIGVDECGKGDFFGPLVVAGVYTDEETSRALMQARIRDSKKIKSDMQAKKLAREIKTTIGSQSFKILVLMPLRYSELYAEFKNLNRLLAWAHATVIEDLILRAPKAHFALSDQFADPIVLEKELLRRHKKIPLRQRTNAEKDIAVAAASILARAEFIDRLHQLSLEVGVPLPKGASQVKEAALEILRKHGADTLERLCKVHFKTYNELLQESLPLLSHETTNIPLGEQPCISQSTESSSYGPTTDSLDSKATKIVSEAQHAPSEPHES
ncbi:MAG: ribonuclease HIII [Methylacidiphilales bacterium]|nr:ribonuclease HIII [Candidatus Methylacidiphilales bacterium]